MTNERSAIYDLLLLSLALHLASTRCDFACVVYANSSIPNTDPCCMDRSWRLNISLLSFVTEADQDAVWAMSVDIAF